MLHLVRTVVGAGVLVVLSAAASACAANTAGGAAPADSATPAHDAHGAIPASDPPCATPSAAVDETFHARNLFGTIEGTLVLPASCDGRPRPVALIIAGSGPTDRNGNQAPMLNAQPYKLMAAALAANGVGSLRYDKGGIAASAKAAPTAESAMRFEMGADDAALLVKELRADPRVGKITIIGHSEGSLVGMLAAERAPVDAFVSLAGAGRPIADILREQLAKGIKDEALLGKANAIIASLASGKTVSDVPTELASLFRPSVQPYLISWMKYDPATELARLDVPSVLVAQGTTDIQVSMTDAQRLAAARRSAKLLVVQGMNHVLKAADMSNASQQDAYANPSLPIVPELVTGLVGIAR
jgi:pimeloyl-ACP methyl ester carboxylesterase